MYCDIIFRVHCANSGITLTVSTTYPAVHFYTGYRLNTSTGKNDHPYKPGSAFVLQCRGLSDAINQVYFITIFLLFL